jgi:16S rRNA processing protein RimM
LVQVGFVLRAHGIRGVVRVRASGDALGALERVRVGARDFAIVDSQRERDDWLVKLAGVDDRNAAEALKGQPVLVERALLPPPTEGEIYAADLVGCRVFDAAGRELGEVRSSFDSGAHEVLEIKGSDGRELMIPLVDGIVTSVDVAARRIDCDPPPGLIDPDEAG